MYLNRDFEIEMAGIRVNQSRLQAFVRGEELRLNPPEIMILSHFLCNPDRAVTDDSLGFAAYSAGGANAILPVAAHLKALRKKLGSFGAFFVDNGDGTYQFRPVAIAGDVAA